MKLSQRDLEKGVEQKIISAEQLDELIELSKNNPENNKIMNLLYYAGTLLVISAMTWLMASSWEAFGGGGIAILTLIYIIGLLIGGHNLYFKKGLTTPGGLLYSIVICLIPLLGFGILRHFNIWPDATQYEDFYIWIKGKWVILELAGLFVGVIILYFVRFPFIVAPIAFGLWFLSMDIVPIIMQTNDITWTCRKYISLIFGIIMLLMGYFANHKSKKPYCFWLYLFGLITLSTALSIYHNDEIFKFALFFLAHLIFIILYIILDQKSFLVFGTIGMIQFLGRLCYDFFADSALLPFILTGFGILLIYIGVKYQKHQSLIEAKIKSIFPESFLNLKPKA